MQESSLDSLELNQSSFAAQSSASAWRYVIVDQGLIAIVVNFVLNWGIAWAIFRKLSSVPLEGELSLTGDTIATCVMFPLISCFIVTALTRNEVRSGRIPAFPTRKKTSNVQRLLSRNVVARAVIFAFLGRMLIAPIALSGIQLTGVESMSLLSFLWFKSLFAVGLGLFFCPFYAWWALHDPVPTGPLVSPSLNE